VTILSPGVVSLATVKILIRSGVLVATVFALTACGSSHTVVKDQAPAQQRTTLPAPLVKRIHSISKDRGVSGKQVVVYGPGSRYLLVKASSGDLVQKSAGERKGFYLVIVHGHFVGFSHPAGTKAPRGTIETQVWSATEGVTDTGISDRLPSAVFRLHRIAAVALPPLTSKPTLTGGIRFSGRIPPDYTATGYQRGRVQILRGRKVVASAHLAQGQGYRFALNPGAYRIRTWGNAKPPYPPCPLAAVKIRADRTARADVYCEFH